MNQSRDVEPHGRLLVGVALVLLSVERATRYKQRGAQGVKIAKRIRDAIAAGSEKKLRRLNQA